MNLKDDGPTEDLSDMAFDKAVLGRAPVTSTDPIGVPNDAAQPMVQAMAMVMTYVNETMLTPIDSSQIRLVWFSKALENWKALVITTLPDTYYYEVTYSGVNKDTCIDVYRKVDQMMIGDSED